MSIYMSKYIPSNLKRRRDRQRLPLVLDPVIKRLSETSDMSKKAKLLLPCVIILFH